MRQRWVIFGNDIQDKMNILIFYLVYKRLDKTWCKNVCFTFNMCY